MTISSILLVCIGRAYPYIINELTSSYQQYRLEIYLKQRLQLLETQLRRAGYCNGDCTVKKASLPAKRPPRNSRFCLSVFLLQ